MTTISQKMIERASLINFKHSQRIEADIIYKLIALYKSEYKIKRYNKRIEKHLFVILNNIAYSRVVAISLNRNTYVNTDFSEKIFKNWISLLGKHSYISSKKGYRDAKANKGLCTRVMITERFRDEIEVHIESKDYEFEFILRKTKVNSDRRYDQKRVELEHQQYRYEILKKHMNILQETDILSDSQRYHYLKARCVFNEDFGHGGRIYYNRIQNERKEIRESILFNGEETIEIDYTSFHVRLLYSLEGIDYDEDAYALDGIDADKYRKLIKLAMLTMINAQNESSWLKAVVQQHRDNCINSFLESDEGKRWKCAKSYEDFYSELLNELNSRDLYNELVIRRVLKLIKEKLIIKHNIISRYLFTGSANMLMNVDSEIAFKIIERFNIMNKPILSMHDSYIVSKNDQELLDRIMNDIYYKVTESIQAA